ncbi:MAG: hypothetical protein SW833_27920 [Cyanobacteriota bacterium]|nr:hypothetical protein [Cyanobacteriota bacterium]
MTTTSAPKQPIFKIGDRVDLKGMDPKWWSGYYILRSQFEEGEWWYAIARPYLGGSPTQKVTQLSLPVAFPERCLRCPSEPEKLTVYGQGYTATNFIRDYGQFILRSHPVAKANANLIQLLNCSI